MNPDLTRYIGWTVRNLQVEFKDVNVKDAIQIVLVSPDGRRRLHLGASHPEALLTWTLEETASEES